MTFEQALCALKAGKCISRSGWNGQGIYIFLLNEHAIVLQPGESVVLQPCICMFTAESKFQPGWLASQLDLLASDWTVIDPTLRNSDTLSLRSTAA